MKLRNVLMLVGLPFGLLVLGLTIPTANAQTETILHSFGCCPDGAYPLAGLVRGSDGNFYGTTAQGGYGKPSHEQGGGALFRIGPGGSYTNLYSFPGYFKDGENPWGKLVQGSDGNFYGTTGTGGTSGSCYEGCGTVFRISPSATYTSLYSFGGSPSDGFRPEAGLVQGSDGNFYGTTADGGTSTNCNLGCGTVFRISPSGNYTSLYSFVGSPTDGEQPRAGLVQGSDGNFYGTTYMGGSSNLGTVFRISPSGSYASLYSFGSSPTDGYQPQAGLVQGSAGKLYGTTFYGGTNDNGTVFQISNSGSETTLYFFAGSPFVSSQDGARPFAGLVQGSDGNFYGTTLFGGTSGGGTLFRITPSGCETNLYSFGSRRGDGHGPNELVQGIDGSFYGTTGAGGTNNYGTVYRLSVPLNPPANQIAGLQVLSVYDMSYAAILVPSVAKETYQLQYTDSMNPTNWINSGDPLTSIGGPVTFFDFVESTTSQRFYRFAITP